MADDSGSDTQRGERRRGRPTMTDVARIAGVSQSSVSLVLNAMTGARISAETQGRVFDAARQIGYELPATRREPALGVERNTIAYLVDEISTSPHPVVNLDGARDFAFEQGFLVAAHVTRSNPELEASTIEAIRRDRSVIGVIYSTIFTRHVRLPPALAELPTVLLNCYAEPRRHLSILPAEVVGGFNATRHLTGARPPPHRLHQWRAVDGRLGRPAEGLPAGAGERRHRLRRTSRPPWRLAAAARLQPCAGAAFASTSRPPRSFAATI